MSRTPDPEPRIPEPGPRLLHVLHRPLGEQFLEPEALYLGSEGRPGASENGRYVNSRAAGEPKPLYCSLEADRDECQPDSSPELKGLSLGRFGAGRPAAFFAQ